MHVTEEGAWNPVREGMELPQVEFLNKREWNPVTLRKKV